MLENRYRYHVSLYKREGGERLGLFAVAPDWVPALEWVRFRALREGADPEAVAAAPACVEPVWDGETGKPIVGSVRVTLNVPGHEPAVEDFPITYFYSAARRISTRLIGDGKLKSDEKFLYLLVATEVRAGGTNRPAPRQLAVEDATPPIRFKNTPLAPMLSRSIAFDKPDDEHLPVFIPQSVLDEAAERSGEAGSNETGGVLIGRLHRDPDGPVFVEVTAQIPARHAKAEVTSLTFTRETWTDVQAALDLRASSGREIMVGWWHTHSFLKEICQDCQKRKDRTCNKDALFLSEDDRVLHRTVFPRAWNVALVVSDAPCSGLSYALFGWSRSGIARRGFHVLDGDRALARHAEPSHLLSTSQERES